MNNNHEIKKCAWMGAVLSLFLSTSPTSFAKEYYKWVDHKGTTHYTTTPPPKSSKSHGKIDTYGYHSPSVTQPTQQNNTSNTSVENLPVTQIAAPQKQNMDSQQSEANAALQNGNVERSAQR